MDGEEKAKERKDEKLFDVEGKEGEREKKTVDDVVGGEAKHKNSETTSSG